MNLPKSFTHNSYDYMYFKRCLWLKVFYHDFSSRENFFDPDKNEALHTGDIASDKYSILSEIGNTMRYDEKYEFIIHWPNLQKYYWWRQTQNPLEENEEEGTMKANGFEPLINGSENIPNWGGLVRTTIFDHVGPSSLLNGAPGIYEWFFAIGLYPNCSNQWKEDGIPADKDDKATDIVVLWLKVPNIYNSICSCEDQHKYLPLNIGYSFFIPIILK